MSEEITPSKKELKAQRKEAKRLEKKKRELLTVSENCKGCGAYMSLDQRFCNSCGAKRMYNRLNWRNLSEDFVDRFLNIENSFLRTFIDLFKRPKDVIDGYINGVRKKHLSAFSYFAISITVVGFYTFVFKQWFLDDIIASGGGMTINTGDELLTDGAEKINRQIFDLIFDNLALFNFLNIPLYAIVSRLVFWNYKKYNFVEHVVIYLYIHSHYQIISSVLGVLFFWSASAQMGIGIFIGVLTFIYTAYVLKLMFDLTIDKLLLKTLLFFMIFGIFSFVFFAAVGYFAFKLGFLDEFIEQTKQVALDEKNAREAKKIVQDSLRTDSINRLQLLVKDSLPGVLKDSIKILSK